VADIINLKTARKRKQRSEKAEKANANRALFGTPSSERRKRTAIDQLEKKSLDAHRIEKMPPDDKC